MTFRASEGSLCATDGSLATRTTPCYWDDSGCARIVSQDDGRKGGKTHEKLINGTTFDDLVVGGSCSLISLRVEDLLPERCDRKERLECLANPKRRPERLCAGNICGRSPPIRSQFVSAADTCTLKTYCVHLAKERLADKTNRGAHVHR